ncbi:MAG: hypothetical protein Q4E39_01405 [bacterium]|nr:hypothetical protein [bacterium]
MVDIIEKIIKKLDEVKDSMEDSQYITDLKTIDNMINGIMPVDFNIVEIMRKRYESELLFLDNLENNLRGFQRNQNNSVTSNYNQYLKNLRHALIRVGVMRILKRKGKKMLEDDLINNDNNNLYNKFVNILEEN